MQCIEGFFARIIMRVKVAWIVTRTLSLGQEPFVKITKTLGAEDRALGIDFAAQRPSHPVPAARSGYRAGASHGPGNRSRGFASLGLARGSLRARLRDRAAGPDVGPLEGRNDRNLRYYVRVCH